MHRPDVHHDALEFPDARIVKVTRLTAGQRAIVLQFPVSPRDRDRVEEGAQRALRLIKATISTGGLSPESFGFLGVPFFRRNGNAGHRARMRSRRLSADGLTRLRSDLRAAR